MQTAVKWVYQMVKRPGQRAMEAGQKPSLCFRGREYMLCVSVGYPVRVLKRPVADFDACRTVTMQGKEYAVKDAVARLREIAERNGITVGASKLLDRVLQGATTLEEDQFNDEEELQVRNETAINETPTEEAVAESATTEKENDVTKTAKKKRVRKTTKPGKVAKAPKGKAAKAKTPKTNGAAKPGSKHRDFEKEVLPIIVKEFKKLDKPKDRPRGFGSATMAVLMEKLTVSKNTADQYYWKAIWDFPKELGIK